MMLSIKFILMSGACYGMTAVMFGAFGAHALKSKLTAEMLDVFDVGVRYQGLHAVVLLFLGLVASYTGESLWRSAALSISVGVLLFSFSLYALALGGPRWFGPITPLGGVLLIVGWALMLWAAYKYEA
jgi:uncharacterized membrane protein YgdD (TMEM256/DUF423 family)